MAAVSSPCAACAQVTEARRLWAEEEEGQVVDDCTAVVALLDMPSPMRAIDMSVGAGIAAPLGRAAKPGTVSMTKHSSRRSQDGPPVKQGCLSARSIPNL